VSEIFNSPFKNRWICVIIIFLFFSLSDSGKCLEFGNLQTKTDIIVSGEYDDNVNLKNGTDEETKEDFILNFNPVIDVLFPYKEHIFSLNFDSDYKKGIKESDLSDFNMNFTGAADFSFAEKLKISLKNEYTDRRFDNALYEESGINRRRSNFSRISFDYKFMERLKAEGGYGHNWDEIENDHQAKEDRNTDAFDGKFFLPVTDSIVTYLSYFSENQSCDENESRNYDDNRYATGLKWTGPYRFSAWIEGGHEKIDFESSYMEDYSNVVGKIGLEIKFTESTKGEISAGQDGYGNAIYNGNIDYNYADMAVRLSIDKHTSVSFSTLYPAGVLETTTANLKVSKKFIEKFTLSLQGSFQNYESFSQNVLREDKIWIGRTSVDYPIQEWLKVGAHYQHSRRDSKLIENEYKDNRVGMFVMFTF